MKKVELKREMDLFTMLELFWHNKLVMIVCILFSLLISGIYINFSKKTYLVTFYINSEVSYLHKAHLVASLAMTETPGQKLAYKLRESWLYSDKMSSFSLESNIIPDIKKHTKYVVIKNEETNRDIYDIAVNNLSMLDSFDTTKIDNTETFSQFIIETKKIISVIDNGQKFLTLSPLSYKLKSASDLIIYISGMFLGLFSSIIFIFIRSDFRSRNSNLNYH